MVVKLICCTSLNHFRLRVVLSHMVVKPKYADVFANACLRVVLSHMVVKPESGIPANQSGLRVVLSHMVVKPVPAVSFLSAPFESSVISYGSQTDTNDTLALSPFDSSVISYGSQT